MLVYVVGLRNGDGKENGTRVGLYNLSQARSAAGRELLLAISDENGVVKGYIDKNFAGKTLKLVIRDIGFKFIMVKVLVEKLGLIYAAKLEKDYVVDRDAIARKHGDLECWEGWESEKEFAHAQNESQKIVRRIKIKDPILWVLYIVFVILGAISGDFFSRYGALIGISVALIFAYISTPFNTQSSRH